MIWNFDCYLSQVPKAGVAVVKSEWFWASIQMDACAEEKYHVFSDHLGAILSPYNTNTPNRTAPNNRSLFSPGGTTPGSSSSNHSRKRKRRREAVSQLAQQDPAPMTATMVIPLGGGKRRSSIGELAHLYDSGSFLLDTPDRNVVGSSSNETAQQTNKSASSLLKGNNNSEITPPNTPILITSPTPPSQQQSKVIAMLIGGPLAAYPPLRNKYWSMPHSLTYPIMHIKLDHVSLYLLTVIFHA